MNNKPVAALISERIQTLGKSQIEITKEAGFQNPNIITMFKQGKTKIPLAKVGQIAKALEMDATHLMKLCISEYQPETWEAVSPYMNQALTRDEVDILNALRSMTGKISISALTQKQKETLDSFIATFN